MKKDFYVCSVCGNMVGMIRDGGGKLVCCGKPMEILTANSVDAAVEKHVPVFEKSGDVLSVTVGSAEHPMIAEHHIEWICVQDDCGKVQRKSLKPGDAPKAVFKDVCDSFTVYAYCNLHGLWKA